jgi:hypothetical protein
MRLKKLIHKITTETEQIDRLSHLTKLRRKAKLDPADLIYMAVDAYMEERQSRVISHAALGEELKELLERALASVSLSPVS